MAALLLFTAVPPPSPHRVTVTIIIPPPPLGPANYTYTMGREAEYRPPNSLLANVTGGSGNLTAVGVTTPPGVGNVTLAPNGTWVFTPPAGWYGE